MNWPLRAASSISAMAAVLLLTFLQPAALGGPPEGPSGVARETPQVPADAHAQAAPAAAGAGQVEEKDPRPVVRLKVTSALRNEDRVFPQVLEGRLITDLADMETFRTVPQEEKGDYLLSLSILALNLNQGSARYVSRDADSNGEPQSKDLMSASLSLSLVVEDNAGRTILEQKLTSDASRELEISADRTASLLTEELIDRAAQKLEKLLRKKLPRPRSPGPRTDG